MPGRARRPAMASLLKIATAVLVVNLVFAAPCAGAAPGQPEPQPVPGPSPAAPQAESDGGEPSPSPGVSPDPDDPPKPEPNAEAEAEPASPGPSPPAHEVEEWIETEPGGGGLFGFFGGLFDIPGAIADALVEAVTGFLGSLIQAAMEPFLELLGQTLLATPQVTDNQTLVEMWRASLGLTMAAYVLLVMAGGLTLMGYETVQTRYALKQIAPRLVVGVVAAALSLPLMERAIDMANALSAAIMDQKLDDTGRGIAEMLLGGALSDLLLSAAPLGGMLHLAILTLVLLVLVAGVLVGYLARAAMVALLAVSAPLALACHGLPQTEGVAKLWWRALGGCLAIQLAQAVTLAVAVRLYFAPGNTILGHPHPGQLETLLSGLCLFWVLWKIPGWTVQVILRGTPATPPHAPAPLRILRSAAIAMLIHRYLPPGRGAAAGRRGAPPARSGPTPPGPSAPPASPTPSGSPGPSGAPGGAGARRPAPPGRGPRAQRPDPSTPRAGPGTPPVRSQAAGGSGDRSCNTGELMSPSRQTGTTGPRALPAEGHGRPRALRRAPRGSAPRAGTKAPAGQSGSGSGSSQHTTRAGSARGPVESPASSGRSSASVRQGPSLAAPSAASRTPVTAASRASGGCRFTTARPIHLRLPLEGPRPSRSARLRTRGGRR
ncbi:hypothetical protein ACTWP5_29515 [Streptomyces sp. 4N509B]|uniref:hypothetical protein n=1 Tax=Streptomyces sp. 4N509B TaxID=3457413 RepID=UPI003FD51F9A